MPLLDPYFDLLQYQFHCWWGDLLLTPEMIHYCSYEVWVAALEVCHGLS